MKRPCAYPKCDNNYYPYMSYFRFPTDIRREIWKKHCGDANPDVKNLFICEAHFYKSDLSLRSTSKYLRKCALPMSNPSICKCSDKAIDYNCFKTLTSTGEILPKSLRPIAKAPGKSASKSSPRTDGVPLKTTTENKNVQKHASPLSTNEIPKTTQKTSKNNEITSDCSMTSENSNFSFTNEEKKIDCLEAVVEYTSQMQNIVRARGGLDSIIQANSHLAKLLDKVVYEWFQRARKRKQIGIITDYFLMKVAQETQKIFCIKNFNPNHEWLDKLKMTYNITDLDMKLLKTHDYPPSLNIYEVILYVLDQNPVEEYFIKPENEDETKEIKTEEDVNMDAQLVISNDQQALVHLKYLEEYVLLKDNFQAIGLISQLKEHFFTDIKTEDLS